MPHHPWTNGQFARMDRTIKDATVKRYHYDSPEQLRSHLADFLDACNFARRLKALSGLMPYEYICKIWTAQPDRFILNPIQQMPGLNTWLCSTQVQTSGGKMSLVRIGLTAPDGAKTLDLTTPQGHFDAERQATWAMSGKQAKWHISACG